MDAILSRFRNFFPPIPFLVLHFTKGPFRLFLKTPFIFISMLRNLPAVTSCGSFDVVMGGFCLHLSMP